METFRETGLGGSAVDLPLLGRMGMGDEIARRTISSLRLLGQIDDQGKPTANLMAFKQASSDTYKQVFAEQLFDVYAPVFAVVGGDLAGKTPTQIEDAFRTFKPDSLRKRMVTLFLGLCQFAGIVGEPPKGKPGPKPGGRLTPKKPPRHRHPPDPDPSTVGFVGGVPGPPPPTPKRTGDEIIISFGEAGTVTLIVDVRWLDLPDEKLAAIRKLTADLRSLDETALAKV